MPISAGYLSTLLTVIAAYAIATMGLNLTMGRAGQVNLGQAAFVGIGAMTSAILTVKLGLPFWIALPMAALVSFMVGSLLGLVSIRLRHDFLAITTIGFNFIVIYIFLYYEVFGASYGIIGIPKPEIAGYKLTGFAYTALAWALLVAMVVLARFIDKTWMGIAFESIRENEDVSESIGIDTKKYKVLAFSLGAMYGGVGGSLLAHFKGYIVYSDFSFPYSIMILSMSIVGGIDTWIGAVAGAAIVILLPEVFRPLMEYRMVMYSALIILMLFLRPEGIFGRRSAITVRMQQALYSFLGIRGGRSGRGR
jgi:branched-chain amino acid transport system permease protein